MYTRIIYTCTYIHTHSITVIVRYDSAARFPPAGG